MKKPKAENKTCMTGGPHHPADVHVVDESPKIVADRKDLDRKRREPRQHAQVVGRLAGIKESKD